MDDQDKQNLEFILSLSKQELRAWFENLQQTCDQYEVEYAVKMLLQAQVHVEMELLDLYDQEAELDVALARQYLQRFRLK